MRCAACGAPLAADQRYCLECGERRATVSDFLRSGPPAAASPPKAPPTPPGPPAQGGSQPRSNTLSLLAGVGVLLLAMGVGVLIGRSGGSGKAPAAAQVVTIGSTGSGSGSSATEEEAFTSDWPAGTKGYTVQLQTLPQSGTTTAQVDQAKKADEAKGAKSVGALKSEEFANLPSGSYVIYSGTFHKRSEAEKALGGLKKSFSSAKVIEVSGGGSSSSSSSSGSSSSSSSGGAPPPPSKPAAPKVLEGLEHAKGKSYEEKSKNLPDVVGT